MQERGTLVDWHVVEPKNVRRRQLQNDSSHFVKEYADDGVKQDNSAII